MNRINILLLSLVVFLTVTCKTQQESPEALHVRQVKPEEVKGFHEGLEMTIAWYPYENLSYKQTSANEWKVVEDEKGKKGSIPVILIRYPETGDSVWLDMNIKSEDLGMLLKHSLMTQEPIKRPFSEFLEVASCTKCHPQSVEVDFDR